MNRLRLCWEILTITSGHAHIAKEKQLSTFQKGYNSGLLDYQLEKKDIFYYYQMGYKIKWTYLR